MGNNRIGRDRFSINREGGTYNSTERELAVRFLFPYPNRSVIGLRLVDPKNYLMYVACPVVVKEVRESHSSQFFGTL